MSVADVQFFSRALNRQVQYSVILPDEGDGPFPVVVQLHGLTDDYRCWVQRSNIVRHAARYPMIVVMPDGGTDGYLNLQSGERLNRNHWEDAIVSDLRAHVSRVFNVRPGGWAIGGLSMGGYGALRLGLKHHERFVSIWAHSSAFQIGETLAPVLENPADASVILHAERLTDVPGGDRPVLSFDCGVDDRLIEQNRAFHSQLDRLGLAHHYAEHPGGHDWDYWDVHVQSALAQHARVFGLTD